MLGKVLDLLCNLNVFYADHVKHKSYILDLGSQYRSSSCHTHCQTDAYNIHIQFSPVYLDIEKV